MHTALTNSCNFISNAGSGFILGDAAFPSGTFFSSTNNCNFSYNGNGMLWDMSYSTMGNCHFSHNTTGFRGNGYQSSFDSYNNVIQNCVLDSNQVAMYYPMHSLITSCNIFENQSGIQSGAINRIKNCNVDSNSAVAITTYNDSVIGCHINTNGAGIAIGVNSVISGNIIEQNTGANISGGGGTTKITDNIIRFGSTGIDYSSTTGTVVICEK